jgi:hypothetical protein
MSLIMPFLAMTLTIFLEIFQAGFPVSVRHKYSISFRKTLVKYIFQPNSLRASRTCSLRSRSVTGMRLMVLVVIQASRVQALIVHTIVAITQQRAAQFCVTIAVTTPPMSNMSAMI